jgi:phage shock protein PspC (stress-responsive transcriptional regulator)
LHVKPSGFDGFFWSNYKEGDADSRVSGCRSATASEVMMNDQQNPIWESLRKLKRSATDKKIAGVCGGFGEHTPIPAWLWRALFLILVFVWGTGLVAYVVLWLCMPAPDHQPKAEARTE